MTRGFCALVTLLGLLVNVPALAARIDPGNAAAIQEVLGISLSDKRIFTVPLFDFAPFPANEPRVIPGFSDPLGTGVDPRLRVFGGKVYYMDLLGDFRFPEVDNTADIELPPGILRGDDLLKDVSSLYLSYNGRAFDSSLLDLQTARTSERGGLPVTAETSPLSLAGFGSVAENLKPYAIFWTRCPAREKRVRAMNTQIQKKAPICHTPAICNCYAL